MNTYISMGPTYTIIIALLAFVSLYINKFEYKYRQERRKMVHVAGKGNVDICA